MLSALVRALLQCLVQLLELLFRLPSRGDFALARLVETSVVDCDRGLRRQGCYDLLGALSEDSRSSMPEKKAAENLARS